MGSRLKKDKGLRQYSVLPGDGQSTHQAKLDGYWLSLERFEKVYDFPTEFLNKRNDKVLQRYSRSFLLGNTSSEDS